MSTHLTPNTDERISQLEQRIADTQTALRLQSEQMAQLLKLMSQPVPTNALATPEGSDTHSDPVPSFVSRRSMLKNAALATLGAAAVWETMPSAKAGPGNGTDMILGGSSATNSCTSSTYLNTTSGYGLNVTAPGTGILSTSTNNSGVIGASQTNNGVWGRSTSGNGVFGTSSSSYGVYGKSTSGIGVYGLSNSTTGTGVSGNSSGGKGTGVLGNATTGVGVQGTAQGSASVTAGIGVQGTSMGVGGAGIGVQGITGGNAFPGEGGIGVSGTSMNGGIGVQGTATDNGTGLSGVGNGTGYGAALSGGKAPLYLDPGSLANPNTDTNGHLPGELYVDSSGGLWYCVSGGGITPPFTFLQIAGASLANLSLGTTNSTADPTTLNNTGSGYGLIITASSTGIHSSASNASGVIGNSTSNNGVWGQSQSGNGILGTSTSSDGVQGSSSSGSGVYGKSSSGYGVIGISNGTSLTSNGVVGKATTGSGVFGNATTGTGVYGNSTSGHGTTGVSQSGYGIYGVSNGTSATSNGVVGKATTGVGVSGTSTSGPGISGTSSTGSGVYGVSTSTTGTSNGVVGVSSASTGSGVYALSMSNTGYGVYGKCSANFGLYGKSVSGTAVGANSTSGSGVYAKGGEYGAVAVGGLAPLCLGGGSVANPNLDTHAHVAGELYVDSSGELWYCAVTGTPGLWRKLAGSATAGSLALLPAPTRFIDTRPAGTSAGYSPSSTGTAAPPPGSMVTPYTFSGSGALIPYEQMGTTAPVIPFGATSLFGRVTVLSGEASGSTTHTAVKGALQVSNHNPPGFGSGLISWSSTPAIQDTTFLLPLDNSSGNSGKLYFVNTSVADDIDILVDISGYYY